MFQFLRNFIWKSIIGIKWISFTEQETGVDTRIVEVDFLDDFVINDKVIDVVKSIEIGILGKNTILPLFHDWLKHLV